MTFSAFDLYRRAATFDEVLSDRFQSLAGQKSDADQAARRLAQWCKVAASGDWDLFAKRMRSEGWTYDFILSRFATAQPNPIMPLPIWLNDAQWVAQALVGSGPIRALPSEAAGRSPLPFEHLLAPIVHEARTRRESIMPASVLGRAAELDLDYQLTHQLCDLAMIALYEDFERYREGLENSRTTEDDHSQKENRVYLRFIDSLRAGPVICERYPVLIRLLSTVTRQWIDTTSEFIARLENDAGAIRDALFEGREPGRVVGVTGGLADVHNEGRSVQLLRFANGDALFYKPKDLAADDAWRGLIERLNANAPVDLAAVRVLPKAGYGWCQVVPDAECASVVDVQEFYRRSGALLALFHALCATDIHEENIIASGAYPVPIDLEMILQPQLDDPEDGIASVATQAAARKVLGSVMTVGLLPCVVRAPDTKLHGIGGIAHRGAPERGVRLEHINTDAMAPVPFVSTEAGPSNLPRFNGNVVMHGDFTSAFMGGFNSYANFLAGRGKPSVLAALDEDFKDLTPRIVLRPTRFYAMMLGRLKDHAIWSDGVLWSVESDFVARFITDHSSEAQRTLARAERHALLELNIPHFTCRADETRISAQSGHDAVLSGTCGTQSARGRLEKLNPAEIAWQARIAELGLDGGDAPSPRVFGYGKLSPSPPLGRAELLANAEEIVSKIADAGLLIDDSRAWIGLCPVPDTGMHQLAPLALDLHSGTSGIAFFLAAHAHVTGENSSRRMSYESFACLRKMLRGPDTAMFARGSGLGSALGLGSYIYALTSAAMLLDDATLLDDARALALLVTTDVIEADRAYDVTGGAAGGILGLLRLYRATKDDQVLRKAIACGDHLLRNRLVEADGVRLWPCHGSQPLTGFSHGASGYAYALNALAVATERDDFAQVASEVLAYEGRLYNGEHGNWPDFRGDGQSVSYASCQWCHGAGGIGLARVGIAKMARQSGESGDDLKKAINRVAAGWPAGNDSLCCGNLGNIQLFADAGNFLERQDLTERASSSLREVIAESKRTGSYRWLKGSDDYNLGLFNGLAGVGYALLREADPSLPNPLLWE